MRRSFGVCLEKAGTAGGSPPRPRRPRCAAESSAGQAAALCALFNHYYERAGLMERVLAHLREHHHGVLGQQGAVRAGAEGRRRAYELSIERGAPLSTEVSASK